MKLAHPAWLEGGSAPLGGMPLGLESPWCRELPGLLSVGECAALIARAEARGFSPTAGTYPGRYRDNDRVVFDDPALAADLFARIRAVIPARVDGDGRRWQAVGCNPRFRCCRYAHGQAFSMHRDGAYVRSADERTWATCQIYLNDDRDFTGGATRFYHDSRAADPAFAVLPETAKAIIFDHDRWHDGAAVTRGVKYVLRSDVMFRADDPAPGHSGTGPGHAGYVWAVAALGDDRFASSGRDGRMMLWSRATADAWKEAGSWTAPGSEGRSITCLAHAGDALFAGTRAGGLYRFLAAAIIGAPTGIPVGFMSETIIQDGPALLGVASVGAARVIAGFADGAVALVHGAKVITRRAHRGFVWSVAAIDDKHAVSAGDDGRLIRWDTCTMTPVVCREFGRPLRAVIAIRGGIVVGDGDGRIHRIGDDLTGLPVSWTAHAGAVTCLARVGDERVVSTGEDGWVVLHDNGPSGRHLHRHGDFATTVCAVGPSIVSGGYDGRIHGGHFSMGPGHHVLSPQNNFPVDG